MTTNVTESTSALQQFYMFYSGPIHQTMSITLCVLGLIANIINIIVLTRENMKGATFKLLLGLSVSHAGLLGLVFIQTVHDVMMMKLCAPWVHSYGIMFFKLCVINASILFHTISLVHTVGLAIFRCMMIKWPTQSRIYASVKTARRFTAGSFILIPILCSPVYLSTIIVKSDSSLNAWCGDSPSNLNQTLPTVLPPIYDFDFGPEIITKIGIWIFGTCFKIIPCIIIFILSLYLIKSLKKAENRKKRLMAATAGGVNLKSTRTTGRRSLGETNILIAAKRLKFRQAQEVRYRTTRMLITIVFLFVLVELPHGMLCFCVGLYGRDFALRVYNNLGDVINMLTLCYSSVNFILYSFMSDEFRRTFYRLVPFRAEPRDATGMALRRSISQFVSNSKMPNNALCTILGQMRDHNRAIFSIALVLADKVEEISENDEEGKFLPDYLNSAEHSYCQNGSCSSSDNVHSMDNNNGQKN